MQLKPILNRVQKFKSFVYGNISWVEGVSGPTLEVELQPRRNSRPVCSVCGYRRPGYDVLVISFANWPVYHKPAESYRPPVL